MSARPEPAELRTGSAAVANLLRLVCSETGGTAAFAAVTGGSGPSRVVAVPPPGSPGGLDAHRLEELVGQLTADPELARARVVVRAVHVGEPLTLAAVPMADPPGFVAVLRGADSPLEEGHVDTLVRVASRLSRHFDALRQLGTGSEPGDAAAQAREEPEPSAPRVVPPPAAVPPLVTLLPSTPARPVPQPATPGAVAGPLAERPSAPAAASATPAAGPMPAPLAGSDARGQGRDVGEGAPPAGGSTSMWCASPDPVTGLPSPARFFSRAGQLLRAPARQSHAFVLVLVEIPNEETATAAARAITGQLRASDPVARVDRDLFALAVLVGTGAASGEGVEERVGSAVRSTLEWLSPVRTTHVRAEPGDRRDVDELLSHAIAALPGREAGSGGAPWRGAGGSAARLPFP